MPFAVDERGVWLLLMRDADPKVTKKDYEI